MIYDGKIHTNLTGWKSDITVSKWKITENWILVPIQTMQTILPRKLIYEGEIMLWEKQLLL